MTDELVFKLTPHACRHCAGRVLQTGEVFRCASCGVTCRGSTHGICGCGIHKGSRPRKPGGRMRTPFRCVPNPDRGPSNPSEIVIAFGNPPGATAGVLSMGS